MFILIINTYKSFVFEIPLSSKCHQFLRNSLIYEEIESESELYKILEENCVDQFHSKEYIYFVFEQEIYKKIINKEITITTNETSSDSDKFNLLNEIYIKEHDLNNSNLTLLDECVLLYRSNLLNCTANKNGLINCNPILFPDKCKNIIKKVNIEIQNKKNYVEKLIKSLSNLNEQLLYSNVYLIQKYNIKNKEIIFEVADDSFYIEDDKAIKESCLNLFKILKFSCTLKRQEKMISSCKVKNLPYECNKYYKIFSASITKNSEIYEYYINEIRKINPDVDITKIDLSENGIYTNKIHNKKKEK